jgi:hypothetical protein
LAPAHPLGDNKNAGERNSKRRRPARSKPKKSGILVTSISLVDWTGHPSEEKRRTNTKNKEFFRTADIFELPCNFLVHDPIERSRGV